MRSRVSWILVLSVLITLPVGCDNITSGLQIDPGQRFNLGGNGNGAFRVEVQNRGDVPVELLAEPADGPLVPVAEIAPGRRPAGVSRRGRRPSWSTSAIAPRACSSRSGATRRCPWGTHRSANRGDGCPAGTQGVTPLSSSTIG